MKLKLSLLPLMVGMALPLAAVSAPPQSAPYGAGPMGQSQGPGMAAPPAGMMAPGRPQPGGMGPAGITPPPPPFAGVQFTPEQQQRINAMMEQERSAHQQRLAHMQQAQQRLQLLYQAEMWDSQAIAKVYDEIFAEQRKTVEAMAKARNRVYELLTPEQRQQMRKMQQPPAASAPQQ